ncbi:MAG TPA: hypothetical protein VEL77_05450 [Rugosimonospora sp.]|jgi:hypothetical protein|nr:hypothetical protein [Rugosimonospora sp.]
MDRERERAAEVVSRYIGLGQLRERIERLLLRSDVQYAVRFDSGNTEGEFAYSWSAIWSEN